MRVSLYLICHHAVLITNRSSNIVEDLETLRLLGRLVPEYCPKLEEEDITKKAFELLFAFDEVINLGYRDSMSLEQVCPPRRSQ